MPAPTTLRTLAGLPSSPPSLADSTLIMIDCQNTYTRGVMELDGVQDALDEAAKLLERARSASIPIVHTFVQTDLDNRLKAAGASNLVLAGFMTHMCVNSTARGAFNLGYAPTVVASATATRPVPGPTGVVPAEALQAASLAAISDLFGIVASDVAAIAN